MWGIVGVGVQPPSREGALSRRGGLCVCYLQPVSTCSDVPLIVALEFCTNVRNMYIEFQYKLIRPCFHVYIAMPKFFYVAHSSPSTWIYFLSMHPIGILPCLYCRHSVGLSIPGYVVLCGFGFHSRMLLICVPVNSSISHELAIFFLSPLMCSHIHILHCVSANTCARTLRSYSPIFGLCGW